LKKKIGLTPDIGALVANEKKNSSLCSALWQIFPHEQVLMLFKYIVNTVMVSYEIDPKDG
jgi:hypothetical protein